MALERDCVTHYNHRQLPNGRSARNTRTDLFAVLRVGEVDEVIVVHLLCVDDVTVLLLAQVLRVDTIGSQELLVSHAESLADGLGDQLRLEEWKEKRKEKNPRGSTG